MVKHKTRHGICEFAYLSQIKSHKPKLCCVIYMEHFEQTSRSGPAKYMVLKFRLKQHHVFDLVRQRVSSAESLAPGF